MPSEPHRLSPAPSFKNVLFCFIEAVSPSGAVPVSHVRRVLSTKHELLEHKVYTTRKRTVGSRLVYSFQGSLAPVFCPCVHFMAPRVNALGHKYAHKEEGMRGTPGTGGSCLYGYLSPRPSAWTSLEFLPLQSCSCPLPGRKPLIPAGPACRPCCVNCGSLARKERRKCL